MQLTTQITAADLARRAGPYTEAFEAGDEYGTAYFIVAQEAVNQNWDLVNIDCEIIGAVIWGNATDGDYAAPRVLNGCDAVDLIGGDEVVAMEARQLG